MFSFLKNFITIEDDNSSPKNKPNKLKTPLVMLIVLDGYGIHPDPEGNAVLQSKTPFLDTVWTKGLTTMLHASGTHVGLPPEEHGNSEVGHLNLGSGRVVFQSLPRINEAIRTGNFFKLPELVKAFEEVKKRGSKMHLMGILSAGGVHGHIEHLFALLEMSKTYKVDPYIHVFLDGRDTGLTDGYFYLSKLKQKIKELGVGKIASISGRFYAMDRDNRWERTQLAYNAMVGRGKRTATDVFAIIQEAYNNGENDQIFIPTTMLDDQGKPIGPIEDNDVAIFYNFREDRARQITKAFVLPNSEFDHFPRYHNPETLYFVTMMSYEEGLPVHVVFPTEKVSDGLAFLIAKAGLKQMHISESEKHMHVTYFFNGGVEKPHVGEDFFNIPSPKVFDYSETPPMSAQIIRDEVMYRLDRYDQYKYSFILINFANPDMLGHTGVLDSAIKGVEFVDNMLKDIVTKVVSLGGAVIITADHGNCETMIDRVTKKINTYHTSNPVPFILVNSLAQCKAQPNEKLIKIGTEKTAVTGMLADVAPTILGILGLEPSENMTGINLLDVL